MQKEVIEALHYFHGGGYIDNLYGDGKCKIYSKH